MIIMNNIVNFINQYKNVTLLNFYTVTVSDVVEPHAELNILVC